MQGCRHIKDVFQYESHKAQKRDKSIRCELLVECFIYRILQGKLNLLNSTDDHLCLKTEYKIQCQVEFCENTVCAVCRKTSLHTVEHFLFLTIFHPLDLHVVKILQNESSATVLYLLTKPVLSCSSCLIDICKEYLLMSNISLDSTR